MKKYGISFCVLGLLCITGCSQVQTVSGARAMVYKDIQQAKQYQNFREEILHTSRFTLFSLLRPARNNNKALHVYIEGDGLAWIHRHKPSTDPTPTKTTAFDLAKHDPSDAAVLYLARPCQYVQSASLCTEKYWTSHRFAPEVIDALDSAIEQIKEKTQAQKIVLIGYSGGGAAATLLAAKRKDIVFLGSAAGNMDIDTWTTWHKVSPLSGSQNPRHKVKTIANLPQRHVMSYADNIVPPVVNKAFCADLQKPEYCVRISGMEHQGDWHTVWDYVYFE